MKNPIDWQQIDAEFDEYLKKEEFVNEQIKNNRKKVKTVNELIDEAKEVNLIIEKNNLKSKTITPKKRTQE